MSTPGQTGKETGRPVILLVRLFVSYQTYEHNVLKMNEPILMLIGASGPRGKDKKRSTLGIGGRSKIKVTRGRR